MHTFKPTETPASILEAIQGPTRDCRRGGERLRPCSVPAVCACALVICALCFHVSWPCSRRAGDACWCLVASQPLSTPFSSLLPELTTRCSRFRRKTFHKAVIGCGPPPPLCIASTSLTLWTCLAFLFQTSGPGCLSCNRNHCARRRPSRQGLTDPAVDSERAKPKAQARGEKRRNVWTDGSTGVERKSESLGWSRVGVVSSHGTCVRGKV